MLGILIFHRLLFLREFLASREKLVRFMFDYIWANERVGLLTSDGFGDEDSRASGTHFEGCFGGAPTICESGFFDSELDLALPILLRNWVGGGWDGESCMGPSMNLLVCVFIAGDEFSSWCVDKDGILIWNLDLRVVWAGWDGIFGVWSLEFFCAEWSGCFGFGR